MASTLDPTLERPPATPPVAAFELQGIVPWGRRLDEYRAFFDLGATTPRQWGRVLDIGGGPASFAAEAAQQGGRVVAADPLYRIGAEAIRQRFDAVRPLMMTGLRRANGRFVYSHYASPEEVERKRMEALELFLADYEWGRACGRYVQAGLPALPFADDAFDLALSSHLLFLYSHELDAAFHLAALRDLLRVAREVRIFPLLTLDGERSPHLPGVLEVLSDEGVTGEIRSVPFEFQKGARQMLRLVRG